MLVRAALERELGDVLPRATAARLLGVHHSSLQRWIDSGDVPVLQSAAGRTGVPVGVVVDLAVELQSRGTGGQGRSAHRLEPIFVEARRRAEDLDPTDLVDDAPHSDGSHERAARRNLAYHRAIACRLDQPMVDAARHQVWRWQDEGRIDERYAKLWLEILGGPIAEIRAGLASDTQEMRDLRQSTPFAGALSEPERRKIWEHVR